MKKKSIKIAMLVALVACVVTVIFVMKGNKGNIENVNRVVGYSALYDERLINEAFNVVEKTFSKEFEGCTLTELRYDDEVENIFAEEMMEYAKENNQELIIILSTFDTDKKGGDGSFNPNDTYTNWQWHLARTADKKSWEIITWGY